jgi:hypothetical protein
MCTGSLKNREMQISLFVFILKMNHKSGIPFIYYYKNSLSLSKIYPKKWRSALMEYVKLKRY